jgi:O-antigen/teichoic acid export membrane protein
MHLKRTDKGSEPDTLSNLTADHLIGASIISSFSRSQCEMLSDHKTPPSKTVVSLRSRMIGAARWVAAGAAFSHVLRLASNLVLTRLLVPEMFGLMTIATTVGLIVGMLSDIGLSQAFLRSKRGEEKAFIDTVWTLQVIRGFVLWAGSLLVALGIYFAAQRGLFSPQSAYGDPILPWLIATTGFWAVINGFASTLAMTSVRDFRLRAIFLLDLIGQFFGLVVMVILAWWTRSIWALVIGSVASASLSAILSHLWKTGERNRFRWDKASVHEVFSYGKWLALSSAMTVFATNGDRIILAAYASAALLGLYSVALSLVGALDTILGHLFDKVMLPAFSEIARNNPPGVPEAYFKLRWRIDPIILFSSGLLVGGAHLLIGTLYDARYAEAGTMLQILALGMIVSRYTLVQQVYLALGKTRYFVPLNVVRLIATFTLIPIGYHFAEFTGALFAIAFRNVPTVLMTFYFNARHGLNNLRLELKTFVFWPAGFALAKGVEWIAMALR